MAVLLLADASGGHLAADSVSKTLTAVQSLGEVHVLVAGPAAAAAEAAGLSGVAKVLHAEDAHGLAEPVAALVAGLAAGIIGAAALNAWGPRYYYDPYYYAYSRPVYYGPRYYYHPRPYWRHRHWRHRYWHHRRHWAHRPYYHRHRLHRHRHRHR